eukprot:COSAG02_NODE_966_length_15587_cov_19.602376_12_plen_304_part_00
MKKTRALLQKTGSGGALLTNWRIHTPICSPSRSELVSGRYFHNIKSSLPVPPPVISPAATGHVNATLYANDSVGVHLRAVGYTVGVFGKTNFNTCQGFDRWFEGPAGAGQCTGGTLGAKGACGGRVFDNLSPNFTYNVPSTEYATSLLGNTSIAWMRDVVSVAKAKRRPFFLYLAPHCPHDPATPAEWYKDECKGVTSPRLPNWNWTNSGYHELIAKQPPLSAADAVLVDDFARRRCQCLMSVDDAHEGLVEEAKRLGVFANTYWFITSDVRTSCHALHKNGFPTGPLSTSRSANSYFALFCL